MFQCDLRRNFKKKKKPFCFFLPVRYGNSTSTYKVRVGDYHTLVPEEHEDEYGVDRLVLHPRYRPQSNDYDLALARLTQHGGHSGECVRQNHAVLPACLPEWREKAPKDLTKCYITGWGDTGERYTDDYYYVI